MANTLRFKRGLVSGIPTAALGEPLFTTDTFDLYIGNGTGNTRFQKYIASGATTQILRGDGSLYTFPLAISSPSAGQVLKYNGTSWVNDSDAGITGSGTTNYLPKFTGATTLGNSLLQEGTNAIGIGTSPITYSGGARGINILSNTTISEIKLTNSTTGNTNPAGLILTQIGLNGVLSNVSNGYLALGTNNTERARLHATGNLHLGGTSDNGLKFQVTGDGYFSGSVGIGTSSLTGFSLLINQALTTGTALAATSVRSTIQSNATLEWNSYQSLVGTQAASFTLTNLRHFAAQQSSLGAGSSVSNQFGFIAASSLVGATNNYGFYGDIAAGTNRWNLYMNGTANNYLAGNLRVGTTTGLYEVTGRGVVNVNGASAAVVSLSAGGSTSTAAYLYYTPSNNFEIKNANASGNLILGAAGGEHVILNASGNLGLGVTPSAWGASHKATQVTTYTSVAGIGVGSGNVGGMLTSNAVYADAMTSTYITTRFALTYYQNTATGNHIWYNAPSGTAGNAITFTQAMTLFATGNLAVGTATDAGFRLDVNGTMRVSGKMSLGNSIGLDKLVIYDGGAPNEYGIGISSGQMNFYTSSTGSFTFNQRNGSTLTESVRINDSGNVGIGVAPSFKLDVNGTFRATGAATFSSSVQAGTAIAIGTTPDTNKPFKILKNINGTVGINFENTSTGSSAFSAIQMGTDVSGGTAFANLVYSSSGVTATGVYQPSGTSLINTGSGGLNFLSVSQPIRFFTSSGNGTERVRIKNEGQVRFVPLASAPSGAEAGDVYYNSTDNKLYCYNGTSWNALF